MAPAGTPKPIVDRLAREMSLAARDSRIADRLAAFGVDPLGSSPAEFAAMVSADIKTWAEAVGLAGLRAR